MKTNKFLELVDKMITESQAMHKISDAHGATDLNPIVGLPSTEFAKWKEHKANIIILAEQITALG